MKTTVYFLMISFVAFFISCTDENPITETKKAIEIEEEKTITVITDRLSAQVDIATDEQIIDDIFIPIGDGASKGTTELKRNTLDAYQGNPVYHFEATGAANRVEFTTCFGSEENLSEYSEAYIQTLIAVKDGYINSYNGDYGDEITYEWSTRFPEAITEGIGGIFAQWHGRPDRALVRNPQGEVIDMSFEQFLQLVEDENLSFGKAATLTGDDLLSNVGYIEGTDRDSGWRVDASAGGPIAAFHIRDEHVYLIVRSDPNRMSTSARTHRVKPKPGFNDLTKVWRSVDDPNKTGAIAFELPLNQVPINEWIDFKVVIKYSKYDAKDDKELSNGYVKVSMNGKDYPTWYGSIGKNDKLGPYFKFGIYKPYPNGFKVDCSSFKQTIKTN